MDNKPQGILGSVDAYYSKIYYHCNCLIQLLQEVQDDSFEAEAKKACNDLLFRVDKELKEIEKMKEYLKVPRGTQRSGNEPVSID